MASSSPNLKSQLHNFSLQDLKWSMNHGGNHRVRKQHAGDSSSRKPPLCGAGSGRVPAAAAPDMRMTETPGKKSSDAAPAVLNPEKKTKIFIRFRTKSSSDKAADDVAAAAAADFGKQESNAEAAEVPELEPEPKVWNLRPRRRLNKKPNVHAVALKIGGAAALPTKAEPLSGSELNNDAKVAAAEKKEKEKERETEKQKEKGKEKGKEKRKEKGKRKDKKVQFSIPLTKQEIEEDVYSLTGLKPSRKPKKRAKHVQKALDSLFPGMWLCNVTSDSYKVHEPHIKVW